MGALIETGPQGTAPLRIRPAQELRGIDYAMPMASAQVKSSLLLAGLYAAGDTCVTEPAPTRDHTERMLRGFGYPVRTSPGRACISGGGQLTGTSLEIPGTFRLPPSSWSGQSIADGSDLTLTNVGMNLPGSGSSTCCVPWGEHRGQGLARGRRRACGKPAGALRIAAGGSHPRGPGATGHR